MTTPEALLLQFSITQPSWLISQATNITQVEEGGDALGEWHGKEARQTYTLNERSLHVASLLQYHEQDTWYSSVPSCQVYSLLMKQRKWFSLNTSLIKFSPIILNRFMPDYNCMKMLAVFYVMMDIIFKGQRCQSVLAITNKNSTICICIPLYLITIYIFK